MSATEWPVVLWCYQVILVSDFQGCCNLLPSPSSSVPRTIARSEIWLPWTLESLYLRAHPKREGHMHAGLRGRVQKLERVHSSWAREIDVPALKCQSGPIWQRGLVVAEGAGMLLSPSAAPLFSGGLPRLETIKCCFSVRMWQQVGPRMKPLPTQSFDPCPSVSPIASSRSTPGQ